MKLSKVFWQTYKDNPADAEIPSHQLMLRAGLMHKAGAGLYNFLPFGLRIVKKIEKIIREEHDKAGCQEVLMTVVTPGELWQESGRWQAMGGEMVKMKDKAHRDLCISPTNEEAITDIFRSLIKSYKDLPVIYYQINTKFRDEIRPRFGLMRGREFIMKDAYSFHETKDCLEKTYFDLYNVYCSILNRIGVSYKVVEADAGAMASPDQKTHEFQLIAKNGEDVLVYNEGYGANIEKARTIRSDVKPKLNGGTAKETPTPQTSTIEAVSKLLNVATDQTMKTLVIHAIKGQESKLVLLCLLGDDTLNETKAKNFINADHIVAASDDQIASAGLVKGFIGPHGHGDQIQVVFDSAINLEAFYIVGANKKDFHLVDFQPKRDCKKVETADLRLAKEGDLSVANKMPVKVCKGIEVGHIFQLGDKYTKSMKVKVLDRNGKTATPLMGCYGIGVTRIAAAVIEQNHDEKGMIWPPSIAPFKFHAVLIGRDEKFRQKCLNIYDLLIKEGHEVLIDDRDVGPGFKFKDADLLGCPYQIIFGEKEFNETSKFKIVKRKDGTISEIEEANLSSYMANLE